MKASAGGCPAIPRHWPYFAFIGRIICSVAVVKKLLFIKNRDYSDKSKKDGVLLRILL